jgi:transcription elongation factor GreB
VDEAAVNEGKFAFVSPIAKAVIGAKLNEIVPFKMGTQTEELQVLEIKY